MESKQSVDVFFVVLISQIMLTTVEKLSFVISPSSLSSSTLFLSGIKKKDLQKYYVLYFLIFTLIILLIR